ncbi:hypothetical protein JCM8202_002112 [Rhodotorula sphaerocarpa]
MAAAPLRPPELGGTADVKDTAKPGETDPSDTLAVLQALAYEGDPSEIAEGFREQGNAGFKQRKFRDAIGFYTRALDEVGKDLSIEERRALWGNRAAANLELGNYGACLRDCSQILGQTNSSYPDLPSDASNRLTMKALFRSARALSALGKLPESLDALKRLGTLGVELGEQDKDAGKGVRIEVERKQAEKERKEAEKAERERRKREGDAAIAVALTHRGVVFPKPTSKTPLFANCPTDVTPPHFDAYIVPLSSLSTIPLLPPPSSADYTPWQAPPPSTPLIFPVLLLLPLESPPTRDLIMAFPGRGHFRRRARVDGARCLYQIPVFCPAVTDGSLGDMMYFHTYKSEIPLNIDIVSDIRRLNDLSIKSKKAGMIILGGGRNGADFSVYINAGQEFDGSDSGARPDETVSWGKIRIDGESVKVYADATLVFPLRVAGT